MALLELDAISSPDDLDWCYSPKVRVSALGTNETTFVFERFADSTAKDRYLRAANQLIDAPSDVLRQAEPFLERYCSDCNLDWEPSDPEYVQISGIEAIWNHVRLPDEVHVATRDDKLYLVLECGCDWEPEHGLMIVLSEDLKLVKLGPYDGHVTNEQAYADPELRGVIYRERSA